MFVIDSIMAKEHYERNGFEKSRATAVLSTGANIESDRIVEPKRSLKSMGMQGNAIAEPITDRWFLYVVSARVRDFWLMIHMTRHQFFQMFGSRSGQVGTVTKDPLNLLGAEHLY